MRYEEKVLKPTSRDDLARECEKIEKKGGDVLEYLRSKGFIYSTRSTWENLQRQCLKRGPLQITTGNPKEEADMAKGKEWSEEELQAIAEETVGIVKAGQDPRTYLRSKGFREAENAWAKMRKIWSAAHPGEPVPRLRKEKQEIETYSPNAIHKKGYPYSTKKGAQTAPKVSTEGNSQKGAEGPQNAKETETGANPGGYADPKALAKTVVRDLFEQNSIASTVTVEKETVNEAGQTEVIRSEIINDGSIAVRVEKMPGVVTCCAPAKPSGVSVPDELPDEPPEKPKKKVKVIMVETEMGTFKREGDCIIFRRNDNDKDYNNTMRLTPEGWKSLMADMNEVLSKLSARAN